MDGAAFEYISEGAIFLLRRRIKKKIRRPMSARPTTPPTTPPAIAPTFVELPPSLELEEPVGELAPVDRVDDALGGAEDSGPSAALALAGL